MDFSGVQALPLEYYFDPLYVPFRESLVANGANYVGHELMVPNRGDYHLLESHANAAMLLNDGNTVSMFSNICRHRQALLIDPINRPYDEKAGKGDRARGNVWKGESGKIICPVHRWSYGMDGALLAAPNFPPQKPMCLPRRALEEWNGFLLDTPRRILQDMQRLGHSGLFNPNLLDMSRYVYAGSDPLTKYNFSLEKFMEVYFDLYHVAPYHPMTFAEIVDCIALIKASPEKYWEFGERYNVQVVGWQKRVRKPKQGYYEARGLINDLYEGKDPPHGALWVTIFPGVMIEWYPHVLVVSTLQHKGIAGCVNQVDYFVEARWQDRISEILPIAQKAYNESAVEDAEICQSMQDGNHAMWKYEEHAVGPRHPALEKGIDHFFKYIRDEAELFGIGGRKIPNP